MHEWWRWINENGALLGWMGLASLMTFVGSLIMIPILVSRIPTDYFSDRQRHLSRSRRLHPILFATLIVFKNLLGLVFILAGMVMLVVPGQGLLTILIGVMLTDFPGKYALERRLISQPSIFNAINWIRDKAGKELLKRPGADDAQR